MSCRIRLRDGGRPKAWLGAAISLVGGLMSSIRQADAQRAQARRERELEGFKNTSSLAANMTTQNSLTANANKAYQNMFRTQFRNGGRLRNVSGMVVQNGGVAQPIGNNTFLLRGMSHDDTDSKGRSGIYLNLNGRDVEAEGGEILHKNGNEFEIISDRIGYGGQSYADHVLNGENPDYIFDMQENNKRRRLRTGGYSSPVREIAALGDSYPPYTSWFDLEPGLWTRGISVTDKYPQRNWFVAPTFTQATANRVRLTNPPRLGNNNRLAGRMPSNYDFLKTQADIDYENRVRQDMQNRVAADMTDLEYNPNSGALEPSPTVSVDESLPTNRLGMRLSTGDWINAGVGVLGSILSNSILQRSLRNMGNYTPLRPIPYQAGKLVTNFSINPQLAEQERQRYEGFRDVDRTTASSVGNLARKNTINVSTTNAENQLFGQKQNIETELLNKDTLNQQHISNMNTREYNMWRDRVNEYNRGIGQARASSNVAMIQGIGDSISGLIESGMNNYNRDLDRRALAAASEPGTIERLINFGYPLDQQTYASIAINSKNKDSRELAFSKLTKRNQRRLRNGGLYVS